MYNHSRLLFIAAFIAPVVIQAQFEGTITMRVGSAASADGGLSITYQIKDNKARFEPPSRGEGMGAAIVLDPGNNRMLVMMPSRQMYMEQAYDAAPGRAAAVKTAPAKVTRTGKKETIAGYQCEHVLVTQPDGKQIDACIAKGLGRFFSAPSNPMSRGGQPADNGWQSEFGADSFPLRVTDGSKVVLEVTSIKKQPMDAALFSAPAGWQKLDLSGMGRMPRPQ